MIGLKIAALGLLAWVCFAILAPDDSPLARKHAWLWISYVLCTVGMVAVPIGLAVWIIGL